MSLVFVPTFFLFILSDFYFFHRAAGDEPGRWGILLHRTFTYIYLYICHMVQSIHLDRRMSDVVDETTSLIERGETHPVYAQ